jgi:hypothetical protein
MLDESKTLEDLFHKITPAGVVGGRGVEDDVHLLADTEDRSCLKVNADDDSIFVGRRGGGDDLRGRGCGRRGSQDTSSGGSSRLL